MIAFCTPKSNQCVLERPGEFNPELSLADHNRYAVVVAVEVGVLPQFRAEGNRLQGCVIEDAELLAGDEIADEALLLAFDQLAPGCAAQAAAHPAGAIAMDNFHDLCAKALAGFEREGHPRGDLVGGWHVGLNIGNVNLHEEFLPFIRLIGTSISQIPAAAKFFLAILRNLCYTQSVNLMTEGCSRLKKRAAALFVVLLMLVAIVYSYSVSVSADETTLAAATTTAATLPVVSPQNEDETEEDEETTEGEEETTDDWEIPTDEDGVTLFPPPPVTAPPTTTTATPTTTVRPTTTRWDPGPIPWRPVPTFHHVVGGGYELETEPLERDDEQGGYIEGEIPEEPDLEDILGTEPMHEFPADDFAGSSGPPGLNWPIIMVAGGLFLVAVAGVLVMLNRNKRLAEAEEAAFYEPQDEEEYYPDDYDEAYEAEPEPEEEAPAEAEVDEPPEEIEAEPEVEEASEEPEVEETPEEE